MIAELWVNQILNDKKTYKQVPRLLKDRVKAILTERGEEEYIRED